MLAAGSLAAGGLLIRSDELHAQHPLAATPSCGDHEATLAETEGPYFKPHSPHRADLRTTGIDGRSVELSGLVLTRSCRPVQNALVDLWHADDKGVYDNKGFGLRGHVFTDADGRYTFRTILPGLYPGRTRHYHVKAQAPGEAVLTTQFYFPDEERNRSDGLFRRELLMRVATAQGGLQARFDIVLALA
ncbi:MAG: intradiol ring-cleavage dioxygenase [Hyphomicrobiales bacterium]|nr:intradiol ring-cleavage dioxygenase [Hyphomicrobiales bacterium]